MDCALFWPAPIGFRQYGAAARFSLARAPGPSLAQYACRSSLSHTDPLRLHGVRKVKCGCQRARLFPLKIPSRRSWSSLDLDIPQSINRMGSPKRHEMRVNQMTCLNAIFQLYGRIRTENYTVEELKEMVWRYFMSYWNNRRICTANGGLPPMVKRQKYYASIENAA